MDVQVADRNWVARWGPTKRLNAWRAYNAQRETTLYLLLRQFQVPVRKYVIISF